MKFRKLRIAWLVLWGLAAVLLIVLWARSYSRHTLSLVHVTPTHRFYLHSRGGTVAIERQRRVFISLELLLLHEDSDFDYLMTNAGFKVLRGKSEWEASAVSVSYWLLVATAACAGTLPLFPWHFSLRTLLIATTLVAVVLGIIVWVSRPI
jgi:hypothetical protein